MKSKKRNKLGTAILCGLPPLSALVVTGVVIGTTKAPEAGLQIVEPEQQTDREAKSKTFWAENDHSKIEYRFEFPGTFTTTANLSDLTATATLEYSGAAAGAVTYDMTGEIIASATNDNSFKLALTKIFTVSDTGPENMLNLVHNTDIVVKNITFKETSTGNEFICKKEYKTNISFSIIWYDKNEVIMSAWTSSSERGWVDLDVANKYTTFGSGHVYITGSTQEAGVALNYGNYDSSSGSTFLSLYCHFNAALVSGQKTPAHSIIIKDGSDGAVMYEKAIDEKPIVKFEGTE